MYDEEIEKAILYYMIFENEDFAICEDDFMFDRNKKIAKAILELKKEKRDISMLSVKSKIKANQEQVLEYLSSLADNIYGSNPEQLYKDLINLTQKRKLFDLAHEMIKKIETEDIENYSQEIIKNINTISNRNEKETNLSTQMLDAMEQIENSWKNKNDTTLYTGIMDLDEKTCGLHNQEFTIIGARPGIGKTTLALQIAQKIAETKDVMFVSLEMSETQLIQKLLANKSYVNTYRMRKGNLDEKDFDKIFKASNEILKLKLKISTKVRTVNQLEVRTKKLKNKGKLDLIIIDYIQLLKSGEKFNNREQEVADISRRLKLLSLELNIPIIALCQLNRNANSGEPTLADLRESGSLEQDADNILFLYYDNDQDADSGTVTIKLAKQRAGDIGKIKIRFLKAVSTFVNLTR